MTSDIEIHIVDVNWYNIYDDLINLSEQPSYPIFALSHPFPITTLPTTGRAGCIQFRPHIKSPLLVPANICAAVQYPGPRLNIKTVLSTYGDFHVKDKTAVRTSYL